jgi:hypothetical protein
MADFIILRKGRNAFSSFLHAALNIALGAGSVYITWATKSPALGLLLVLLSKWRMFAVRPRYWELNFKANLLDLIVGCSFILITYCSGPIILPVHFIMAALYSIWLVFIKSKSSEAAVNIQSLIAIFFGTTALTLMAASADSWVMPIGGFIIGYAAARHILIQGDEKDINIIVLAGAIIFAEIAWLCHSWLIVYTFPEIGLIIPQLSIIMVILSFLFGFTYKAIQQNEGKMKWSEVGMPTIFFAILIMIIVIFFSQPIFNV